MTQTNTRLMIVYNADSGILNALAHAVHKAIRPSTYPCSLCALTYGAVSMRRQWRHFLSGLRMDKVFHHRDDFSRTFPGHSFALPAILISENGNPLRILVSNETLDRIHDVEQLIAVVEERLAMERGHQPILRAEA